MEEGLECQMNNPGAIINKRILPTLHVGIREVKENVLIKKKWMVILSLPYMRKALTWLSSNRRTIELISHIQLVFLRVRV